MDFAGTLKEWRQLGLRAEAATASAGVGPTAAAIPAVAAIETFNAWWRRCPASTKSRMSSFQASKD